MRYALWAIGILAAIVTSVLVDIWLRTPPGLAEAEWPFKTPPRWVLQYRNWRNERAAVKFRRKMILAERQRCRHAKHPILKDDNGDLSCSKCGQDLT